VQIFVFARIALTLIPAGWSVINLFLLLRKRQAPAEAQAHLLAVCSGALLATALWLGGRRQFLMALLPGVLGTGCAIAWFFCIYRQSLHNTTM
jgi:hypothetical protein